MHDFRAESKFETMWSLLASCGAIKVRPIISVQAHTSPGAAICTVLK
jgi:hypothetical protein